MKNLRAKSKDVVHDENSDLGVLRTDSIGLQVIEGSVRALGRVFSLNRGDLRATG